MYTKKYDSLFIVKSLVFEIFTHIYYSPSFRSNYPIVHLVHFCSFRQRIIDIDRFADEISTYRVSAARRVRAMLRRYIIIYIYIYVISFSPLFFNN